MTISDEDKQKLIDAKAKELLEAHKKDKEPWDDKKAIQTAKMRVGADITKQDKKDAKAKHLAEVNSNATEKLGEEATPEEIEAEVDHVLEGEELEATAKTASKAFFDAQVALEEFKNPAKASTAKYTPSEKKLISDLRLAKSMKKKSEEETTEESEEETTEEST